MSHKIPHGRARAFCITFAFLLTMLPPAGADSIPTSQNVRQLLAPDGFIDLNLSLFNPGRIEIAVYGGEERKRRLADSPQPLPAPLPPTPTRYRIDLFAAGGTTPVMSYTSSDLGNVYGFDFSRSGRSTEAWRVRLTNLESKPVTFRLVAKYPGPIELYTTRIPLSEINAVVGPYAAGYSVHLDRGTDASFIQYPSGAKVQFTIREFATNPWWRFPITQYPNDINSNTIQGSLVKGEFGTAQLKVVISFEEEGTEIRGNYSIQLSNMKLTVRMDLGILDRLISYPIAKAHFEFGSDIENVPDWFIDYRRDLASNVERHTVAVFQGDDVRDPLSQLLTDAVLVAIRVKDPGNARDPVLYSVRADATDMIVQWYNEPWVILDGGVRDR